MGNFWETQSMMLFSYMFLAWKVASSDLSLICNECFSDAFVEDGREEKVWEKNVYYIVPEIRELALISKNYESETILPFPIWQTIIECLPCTKQSL